jgi:hypothetical protein
LVLDPAGPYFSASQSMMKDHEILKVIKVKSKVIPVTGHGGT